MSTAELIEAILADPAMPEHMVTVTDEEAMRALLTRHLSSGVTWADGIDAAVALIDTRATALSSPNQWAARDLLQSVARKVSALRSER